MTSRVETELAALLLNEAFGTGVAVVGTSLLRNGPARLDELTRRASKGYVLVRDALRILIIHNHVTVSVKPVTSRTSGRVRTATYYEASVGTIMGRLLFPRCVLLARKKFGDEGAYVLKEIVLRGRTSLLTAMESAVNEKRRDRSEKSEGEEKRSAEDELRERIHTAFVSLEDAGYISPVEPRWTGKRKREEEEIESTQTSDTEMPPRVPGESGPVPRAPKKRKKGVIVPATVQELAVNPLFSRSMDLPLLQLPPTVGFPIRSLYRIDLKGFLRSFAREAMIDLFNQKYSPLAGAIANALLVLPSGETAEENLGLSLDEICERLSNVNRKDVVSCIETMLVDSVRLVDVRKSPLGEKYNVVEQRCLRDLRARTIESTIELMHGGASRRIFHVLCVKKMLDQKHIAEIAMLPPKETRERLYALYRENILHVQEVPKSAERVPSKTSFLWHASIEYAGTALMNRVVQSITRLKQRMSFHLQKHDAVVRNFKTQNDLEESERQELEELRRVTKMLQLHVARAQQTLAVLREYK